MGTPFIGELKIVPFTTVPKGWAACNGQLLPINQNQALFSLLGTTYGGNGQTNFALPNLQGRTPIHTGAGFTQGQSGGEVAHTLTASEMPQHVHFVMANSGDATQNAAFALANPPLSAGTLAGFSNGYTPAANLVAMSPQGVTNVGGSQPHQNLQPYLGLSIIIALQGVFPSRN